MSFDMWIHNKKFQLKLNNILQSAFDKSQFRKKQILIIGTIFVEDSQKFIRS